MATSRSKSFLISSILNQLDHLAPLGTAEKWDNVGLLIGSPEWRTKGAIVSVDLTRASVERAKKLGFRLIVNHHPCIFSGMKKVVSSSKDTLSTLMVDCIRHQISVVSFHTNFDKASTEVVAQVAKGLGVIPQGRLFDSSTEPAFTKLVVFVPKTHVEQVREQIGIAGAGRIGQYDFCTFGTPGEGTFRALEGADPFLGKVGKLEKAEEIRLETILPIGFESKVLRALRKAHPYEEIAYDLYPVHQEPSRQGVTSGLGYGFWGDFSTNISFSEVARRVKRLFKVNGYWVTSPPPKKVRRLGFVAGKGSSFLKGATRLGIDLFITGEAGYHNALKGAASSVAVMEIGHRESERFYLETMKSWLSQLGLETRVLYEPTQTVRT